VSDQLLPFGCNDWATIQSLTRQRSEWEQMISYYHLIAMIGLQYNLWADDDMNGSGRSDITGLCIITRRFAFPKQLYAHIYMWLNVTECHRHSRVLSDASAIIQAVI
jgi:hypothetical protein